MASLKGMTALVTGGASGIGAATVRSLAARGVEVVVVDCDEPAGRAVADDVGGQFIAIDVGDADAWASLPDVDLVHLNAGVMSGAQPVPLEQLTPAAWARVRSVNLDGVAYGILATTQGMARRGGGALVCTASGAGLGVFPPDPFYAATKHATIGLARSIAPLLAARGVAISVVCPPRTETPMYRAAAGPSAAGTPAVLAPAVVGEVVARVFAGEAPATDPHGKVFRIEADGSFHVHEFLGELGRPPR